MHRVFSEATCLRSIRKVRSMDRPARAGHPASEYLRQARDNDRTYPIFGWADLREDNITNPVQFVCRFLAPWGPRRAPGALGAAPARKIVQVAPKTQPRRPTLSPIRGHFVFLGPTAKRYKIDDKIYV